MRERDKREGARQIMIIIGSSGGRGITLPRNVITISPANEQQSPASIYADKYDDDVQRHDAICGDR